MISTCHRSIGEIESRSHMDAELMTLDRTQPMLQAHLRCCQRLPYKMFFATNHGVSVAYLAQTGTELLTRRIARPSSSYSLEMSPRKCSDASEVYLFCALCSWLAIRIRPTVDASPPDSRTEVGRRMTLSPKMWRTWRGTTRL